MIGAALAPVALAVTGAALVAGAVVLVSTGQPATALGALLDLLLAAGLLRLSGDPGWEAIATSAVVVALRHVVGTGLRLGGRAWRRPGPAARAQGDPRRALLVERLLRPAWRR